MAMRPGMTKTQLLREQRATAIVSGGCKNGATQQASSADGPCPKPQPRSASTVCPPKSVPRAPPSPRRVDFSRPATTKATQARAKAAEKKLQEMERKKEEETADALQRRQRQRRAAAPAGGGGGADAAPTCPAASRPASSTQIPQVQFRRMNQRQRGLDGQQRATAHVRATSGQKSPVNRDICELAKSLNANVVQADQVQGQGPIDSVVVEPGAIRPDQVTIIALPQSAQGSNAVVAEQTIRVISEALQRQENTEVAMVNDKLTTLQSARRDFLMAIANVSGNAVNFYDEGVDAADGVDECGYRVEFPESPRPVIYGVPDIDEDEQFQPCYQMDHPDVQAARQHLQRGREREARRRLDDEFDAIMADEREILDDIGAFCRDSPFSPPPPAPSSNRQAGPCDQYPRPFNPMALDKFFDLDNYPPEPQLQPQGPPPGREGLHPDLWDVEDPWCNNSAAQRDLIEFST